MSNLGIEDIVQIANVPCMYPI